jgi:cell wall-associated NlpC family hydrolase
MRAWQAGGVALPHWSVAQYEQSQPVSSSDARPGDLVFFASDANDYRSIYHVGLYLGGGLMIEAPHTGDVVKIIAVYPNDFFGYARP